MTDNTTFINPFPGLRAFEEHEDVLFFGREKQVDELLKKLRITRFLTVIGSSGSGKSSLVKSGLIPALHSGFMSGAGSRWRMCSFRPGTDPIGNLAHALVDSLATYPQTEEDKLLNRSFTESTLRRSNFGLIEAYKQSGIDRSENLLVLVDQFEELFRFSSYEKKAMEGRRDSVAFINLLLKASEQRDLPIYVVFTMRSDFLGDCTEFRGLPEAINEGQYLVPRMTRDERREAISGPVAVGGGTMAPRLLNRLLNDVGDNPDQLPILQHALMRTWENWYNETKTLPEQPPIDVDNYEHIGTMAHALSQHAEEAFTELATTRERQICEVMFKAITDKGFNTTGIRRPRKLAEICELLEAAVDEVVPVIEVFRRNGRAFLMPPQGVELTGDSIIDISHESLMRVWDRLILWVDEESQSAQIYLRLCEAADLYETGKGGLLRDPELQVAWKWKEENAPNAKWAARYNELFEKAMIFLDHSKQEYERELAHKELMQKQSLQRARRIAGVIAVIALAAFLLSIYSFELRNEATKQTKIAERQTHAAQSERQIALTQKHIAVEQQKLAERSKEQALEQRSIAEGEKKKSEASEKNALLQKTIAEQQKAYAERQKVMAESNAKLAKEQQGIAETQTGKAVANERSALEQKQISTRLRDLAESRNLAYESVLLLNDKKYDESRKAALDAYQLNADNKGPTQNNDIYAALNLNWAADINNKNISTVHKFAVRSIVPLGEGNRFVSADESGKVYVFKGSDGILQPLGSTDLKEDVRVIAPVPATSNILALTAGGNAVLLQLSGDGASLKTLSTAKFEGIGKSILFDRNQLLIISNKGIGQYSLDGNAIVQKKFTPSSNLSDAALGTNTIYLTSGDNIYAYKTFNDIPNNPASTFKLSSKVLSVAVDPTGTYLAAGTYDGGIWIKNIKTDAREVSFNLHASAINDVAFRPENADGHVQLATASSDQTVKLLDVPALITSRNTEDIITLRNHVKWVYKIAYSPDGQFLYTASEDKRIIGSHATMSGIYNDLKKNKK